LRTPESFAGFRARFTNSRFCGAADAFAVGPPGLSYGSVG
jgi:hypothetical protein